MYLLYYFFSNVNLDYKLETFVFMFIAQKNKNVMPIP